MGKTLEAVKRVKIANVRIKTAHKISVKPVQLNKLVKKLAGYGCKPLHLWDINALFKKVKNIYINKKGQLTRREIKNLPFILTHASNVPGMVDFVFSKIEFEKFITFKRALIVYFETYGDEQITPRLSHELLTAIKNDSRKRDVLYLGDDAAFLKKRGPQAMAMCFKDSLKAYFDNIIFPEPLQYSRFVYIAIICYFGKNRAELGNKVTMLEELAKDESYKSLIPQIAEPLIFAVEKESDKVSNSEYRERVLFVLHHEMGDPRYTHKQVSWSNVSAEAQRIFISWLKRGDLELFFAVIDRTMFSDLADGVDAKNMWHERKTFWEKYLDKMYYTKVILAPEAIRIVKREYPKKILDYGWLDSSNRNQSLFVFSIGDYVFSEASYNGKLRIWKLKASPIQLDEELRKKEPVNYSDDIVHTYTEVQEFAHLINWQGRVRDWINEHCY